MAITLVEFTVLLNLRQQVSIPPRPDILELGEQQWHPGLALDVLVGGVRDTLANEPQVFADFIAAMKAIQAAPGEWPHFDVIKQLYRVLFDYASYTSVDFHGPPSALKLDLNEPLPIDRQFHIVTNIGTAEHVFDVAQVFKTVHERTLSGGLMIHTAPFTGFWNHGFYGLHPTLFLDLAAANGYGIEMLACGTYESFRLFPFSSLEEFDALAAEGSIPEEGVISCVYRKGDDKHSFRKPPQGYYAKEIVAALGVSDDH